MMPASEWMLSPFTDISVSLVTTTLMPASASATAILFRAGNELEDSI
jgi:hypothetical protein